VSSKEIREVSGLVKELTEIFLSDISSKTTTKSFSIMMGKLKSTLEEMVKQTPSNICTRCKGTGGYVTMNSPSYGRTDKHVHICEECEGFGTRR
jgi:DnaJ-class molecular chaperone